MLRSLRSTKRRKRCCLPEAHLCSGVADSLPLESVYELFVSYFYPCLTHHYFCKAAVTRIIELHCEFQMLGPAACKTLCLAEAQSSRARQPTDGGDVPSLENVDVNAATFPSGQSLSSSLNYADSSASSSAFTASSENSSPRKVLASTVKNLSVSPLDSPSSGSQGPQSSNEVEAVSAEAASSSLSGLGEHAAHSNLTSLHVAPSASPALVNHRPSLQGGENLGYTARPGSSDNEDHLSGAGSHNAEMDFLDATRRPKRASVLMRAPSPASESLSAPLESSPPRAPPPSYLPSVPPRNAPYDPNSHLRPPFAATLDKSPRHPSQSWGVPSASHYHWFGSPPQQSPTWTSMRPYASGPIPHAPTPTEGLRFQSNAPSPAIPPSPAAVRPPSSLREDRAMANAHPSFPSAHHSTSASIEKGIHFNPLPTASTSDDRRSEGLNASASSAPTQIPQLQPEPPRQESSASHPNEASSTEDSHRDFANLPPLSVETLPQIKRETGMETIEPQHEEMAVNFSNEAPSSMPPRTLESSLPIGIRVIIASNEAIFNDDIPRLAQPASIEMESIFEPLPIDNTSSEHAVEGLSASVMDVQRQPLPSSDAPPLQEAASQNESSNEFSAVWSSSSSHPPQVSPTDAPSNLPTSAGNLPKPRPRRRSKWDNVPDDPPPAITAPPNPIEPIDDELVVSFGRRPNRSQTGPLVQQEHHHVPSDDSYEPPSPVVPLSVEMDHLNADQVEASQIAPQPDDFSKLHPNDPPPLPLPSIVTSPMPTHVKVELASEMPLLVESIPQQASAAPIKMEFHSEPLPVPISSATSQEDVKVKPKKKELTPAEEKAKRERQAKRDVWTEKVMESRRMDHAANGALGHERVARIAIKMVEFCRKTILNRKNLSKKEKTRSALSNACYEYVTSAGNWSHEKINSTQLRTSISSIKPAGPNIPDGIVGALIDRALVWLDDPTKAKFLKQ